MPKPRGSRPGERRGGRKKGTPNKVTKSKEQLIAEFGITPLAVLLKVMHYHDHKADLAKERKDPAEAERHMKEATAAANSAAPYSHARLSAVQMSGGLQISHEEALKMLK